MSRCATWLALEMENRGWDPVQVRLRDLKVGPCNGCFHCWTRTPGLCDQDDDGRELTRQLAQVEALVLVTPVRYGGYSSLVKRSLERAVLPFLLPFFTEVHGEVHHPLRYGRKVRLAALGCLPKPDPDSESLFQKILQRNALNFHATDPPSAFVYGDLSQVEAQGRVAALAGALGGAE